MGDEGAARARWWTLFEAEFGLQEQPYCGAEHTKTGRSHEHRVYGLVRPSGAVVDLSWDYARREKCSRIVERAFGMRPVASRHARAIERQLRLEGRAAVADWLESSGATTAERPVAAATPGERLQQERTGIALDDVRRSVLAAWRDSGDGTAFVAGLRARGLDLRQGRKGPVVVDTSGAAHLATRAVGAAARRFEGRRILAADVRARLDGLQLENMTDGRGGPRGAARRAGSHAARDRGGAGPGAERNGDLGLRGSHRDAGRADGGGRGRHPSRTGAALARLRALPPGRRIALRRRLQGLDPRVEACIEAAERARDAVARLEEESLYERDRAWALWGMTDVWGIPLR
ncbi:relaxase/mobilization nuclease domain-containing protein [Methylobacterium pseudosasicola]|uniref:relaxase/mobilization nuclease domain-containing protein n=1 Tax=Methylobacterium pseudosasicola TaxID=582667 RepID=UPI003CC7A814